MNEINAARRFRVAAAEKAEAEKVRPALSESNEGRGPRGPKAAASVMLHAPSVGC